MELGGLIGTIRLQSKVTVAPATRQFHGPNPILSTESSRIIENKHLLVRVSAGPNTQRLTTGLLSECLSPECLSPPGYLQK